MPVPIKMADLALLAGSNDPQGSESIGNNLDNYIRSHAAILRSTNALSSASIPAASTTDLATSDGESVTITGAATITSFGSGFNGCRREVRFASVCTIVYSGNIVISGATNLITAAGDVLSVRCVGTGQWIVTGISNIGVRRTGDTMTGALEIGTTTGYQIRTGVTGQSNYFEQGMGVTGPTDPDYFMYNRANGAIWLGTNNQLRGKILASGALEWVSPIQVTTTDPLKVILWQSVDDAGTSYSSWDHRDGYNVGAYRWRFNGTTRMTLDRLGVLSVSGGVTPGSGRLLSKVTLANTAPGALANGELYLRY